jgi:cysteine sulfinate desulfinase/cysteine desulfurase-like protein
MGCSEHLVDGALRLSLGATTTALEITQACERILAAVEQLAKAT